MACTRAKLMLWFVTFLGTLTLTSEEFLPFETISLFKGLGWVLGVGSSLEIFKTKGSSIEKILQSQEFS